MPDTRDGQPVLDTCEACGKTLAEGVHRFCGEACRVRFVEGLRKGTRSQTGRTVARRRRRRGR